MEKINFINGSTPALNDTNLNKLQDNVEDAIGEVQDNVDNLDTNKVDKSSVKTTQTTSDTDTYSCNYINDIANINSYTFTPVYTAYTPLYRLEKVGNIVIFNFSTIYLASVTANTWVNIGTIPSSLSPSIAAITPCIVADSDTGQIKGYGRCEVQTDGNVRLKVNVTQTLPFFTGTLVWTK